jgi:hypothetical protein
VEPYASHCSRAASILPRLPNLGQIARSAIRARYAGRRSRRTASAASAATIPAAPDGTAWSGGRTCPCRSGKGTRRRPAERTSSPPTASWSARKCGGTTVPSGIEWPEKARETPREARRGGMPERPNGAVLKTAVPARVPWVRIPLPPLDPDHPDRERDDRRDGRSRANRLQERQTDDRPGRVPRAVRRAGPQVAPALHRRREEDAGSAGLSPPPGVRARRRTAPARSAPVPH